MTSTWFADAVAAIEDLDVERLRSLLGSDQATIDEQDEVDGFSLLHFAVDAEIDAHNNLGWQLEPRFTRLLLNAGVDRTLRSRAGETARDTALQRSHTSAAELLATTEF